MHGHNRQFLLKIKFNKYSVIRVETNKKSKLINKNYLKKNRSRLESKKNIIYFIKENLHLV